MEPMALLKNTSKPSNHWKTSLEIILFFDGDKAGKEGVKKNAEIIQNYKAQSKIPCRDTRRRRYQIVGHSLPRQAEKKKSSPTYWNPEKK
jgi:hypothetical protein